MPTATDCAGDGDVDATTDDAWLYRVELDVPPGLDIPNGDNDAPGYGYLLLWYNGDDTNDDDDDEDDDVVVAAESGDDDVVVVAFARW